MLQMLSPFHIFCLRSGLNPRTLGPMTSTLDILKTMLLSCNYIEINTFQLYYGRWGVFARIFLLGSSNVHVVWKWTIKMTSRGTWLLFNWKPIGTVRIRFYWRFAEADIYKWVLRLQQAKWNVYFRKHKKVINRTAKSRFRKSEISYCPGTSSALLTGEVACRTKWLCINPLKPQLV
jgi:hypothetical protein